MKIRRGKKADLPRVYELIKELAEFEREPDAVTNTLEMMEEDGFGENPIYDFFVAESQDQLVGLALFYFRYSTWKGRCLYLEDLIVTEQHRNRGLGKRLLETILAEASRTQCQQVMWQVLDWNEPAIKFYEKMGATVIHGWLNVTMSRSQLDQYN